MRLGGGRIHLQGSGKAMLNPLDFTLGVKGSPGRFEQESGVTGVASQISLATGQGRDFFFSIYLKQVEVLVCARH